jgi:hypothetical protein
MMFYTGVGSRSTPTDVIALMKRIANYYRSKGYVLRSGGAKGADTAFELGAKENKEIYIPWRSFSTYKSHIVPTTRQFERAYVIASAIHPVWGTLSDGVKKLHARNIFQVLGLTLDTPSNFLVYWAQEVKGEIEGGTRTAVVCARNNNIPTFNLLFQWEEFRRYTKEVLIAGEKKEIVL